MSEQEQNSDQQFNRRVIDIAIKLSALAFIVAWCFQIIRPFILIFIWAGILAVALHPLHVKLTKVLRGNKKLASTIIALVGISLVTIPTISLSSSSHMMPLYRKMYAEPELPPEPSSFHAPTTATSPSTATE